MVRILYICLTCCMFFPACRQQPGAAESQAGDKSLTTTESKIPVLNFATFHMDYTPDAHKEDFDKENQENLADLKTICEKLAQFKPTVILVELPPEKNAELQAKYRDFLDSGAAYLDYYGEIGLLAFQVGRLSGCDRIYGIDHPMDYNYMIADQLADSVPSETYRAYMAEMEQKYFSRDDSTEKLLDKLRERNSRVFLDFVINVNADILTYVNSEKGFEGADEAAKFYHRNLRMFANMNKVPLRPDDRVFILMGAAHSAFFHDFLGRSPKYKVVDALDFLP